MGGTLAKAVAAGKQVHLVTATRDERGISGMSAAETAVLRETELRCACGEVTVESYTRVKNRKIICMPCAEAH